MKPIKCNFLVLLLFILFYTGDLKAKFLDKGFYLVDSLDIHQISEKDKTLIDSTLSIYHNTTSDTLQMNLIFLLAEKITSDIISPRYNSLLYQKTIDFEHKINRNDSILWLKTKKMQAMAITNFGYYSIMLGNTEKALDYYKKSYLLLDEIKDKRGLAMYYNSVGYIYINKGKIAKGLEYLLQSLKLREEIGDSIGASNTLINIGYTYKDQGDLENALLSFKKSLELNTKLKNQYGIAYSLEHIANIYERKKETENALELYRKSLAIRLKIEDEHGIGYSLHNIGRFYSDTKKIDSALIYLAKSRKIRTKIKDQKGLSTNYRITAKAFFSLNDDTNARIWSEKSLALALKLGYPKEIAKISRLLYLIYKRTGEYEKSLQMHEQYISLKDSIKNKETQKITIRQQMQYEYEKETLLETQKEKEKERLQQEKEQRRNNIQYSGILVFVLLLFALVFMSGSFSISEKFAEGLIFFTFLLFFEFCLVLLDPFIDSFSEGEPAYKLFLNAILAATIFPLHSFFEKYLKEKLIPKIKK